jgi:hypothetical protein
MITGPLSGVSVEAPFQAATLSWTETFPQPVGTFTFAAGGSVTSGRGVELTLAVAGGGDAVAATVG